MKHQIIYIISLYILISPGCSEDKPNGSVRDTTPENPFYIFGSISDDDRNIMPLIPVKSIDDVGLYPSDITLSGNEAYIVDSGNNAIHKLHLDNLALNKNAIIFDPDTGPYTAFATESDLYVACNVSPKVVDISLQNSVQNTLMTASEIKSPSDIWLYQTQVIVADSEYDFTDNSKTEGKIILRSANGTVTESKTATPNPVFIQMTRIQDQDYLLISNAGILKYSAEGYQPPERSCLEIRSAQDLSQSLIQHCIHHDSFGRISQSETDIYIGDGILPVIHQIAKSDLLNPAAQMKDIVMSQETPGMTTPLVVDNALVAINYNQDQLVWIDDSDMYYFRLSSSDAAQKSPTDLVYDRQRKQILVLNGAGSVDILKNQR